MGSPTNFLPTDATVPLSSANLEMTLVDKPRADPVAAVISVSGGNYARTQVISCLVLLRVDGQLTLTSSADPMMRCVYVGLIFK